MRRQGRDFFVAFFAVCSAALFPFGYPPFRLSQIEDHLRRQAILSNAEACALITNDEIRIVGRLLYRLVSGASAHC
jgi:hypothetical protein